MSRRIIRPGYPGSCTGHASGTDGASASRRTTKVSLTVSRVGGEAASVSSRASAAEIFLLLLAIVVTVAVMLAAAAV